jgi:hypothetical protein
MITRDLEFELPSAKEIAKVKLLILLVARGGIEPPTLRL